MAKNVQGFLDDRTPKSKRDLQTPVDRNTPTKTRTGKLPSGAHYKVFQAGTGAKKYSAASAVSGAKTIRKIRENGERTVSVTKSGKTPGGRDYYAERTITPTKHKGQLTRRTSVTDKGSQITPTYYEKHTKAGASSGKFIMGKGRVKKGPTKPQKKS